MTFSTVSTLAPSDSISVRGDDRSHRYSRRRPEPSRSYTRSSRRQPSIREASRLGPSRFRESTRDSFDRRERSYLEPIDERRTSSRQDVDMDRQDTSLSSRYRSSGAPTPRPTSRGSFSQSRRTQDTDPSTMKSSYRGFTTASRGYGAQDDEGPARRTSRGSWNSKPGSSNNSSRQSARLSASASSQDRTTSSRSSRRDSQSTPLTLATRDSNYRSAPSYGSVSPSSRLPSKYSLGGRQRGPEADDVYVQYTYGSPVDVKREVIVQWV